MTQHNVHFYWYLCSKALSIQMCEPCVNIAIKVINRHGRHGLSLAVFIPPWNYLWSPKPQTASFSMLCLKALPWYLVTVCHCQQGVTVFFTLRPQSTVSLCVGGSWIIGTDKLVQDREWAEDHESLEQISWYRTESEQRIMNHWNR